MSSLTDVATMIAENRHRSGAIRDGCGGSLESARMDAWLRALLLTLARSSQRNAPMESGSRITRKTVNETPSRTSSIAQEIRICGRSNAQLARFQSWI